MKTNLLLLAKKKRERVPFFIGHPMFIIYNLFLLSHLVEELCLKIDIQTIQYITCLGTDEKSTVVGKVIWSPLSFRPLPVLKNKSFFLTLTRLIKLKLQIRNHLKAKLKVRIFKKRFTCLSSSQY